MSYLNCTWFVKKPGNSSRKAPSQFAEWVRVKRNSGQQGLRLSTEALDALIVRNVPNVRKAVKWNSPFYGIEGQGWFLSFHVLTR